MSIVRVEPQQSEDGEEQYTVQETPMAPAWSPDADLRVVGKAIPRGEGDLKVTGRAQYAYDVRLPGQLYARVLRSPHAHARIRRIDTAKAAAHPGVRTVLCRATCPNIPWSQDTVLFSDIVRYIGEEVAAVAADSEEVAEDALRLVEVEYEPLPFVADPVVALEPGTPKIHDSGNLAGEPQEYERGDVAGSAAQADLVIEQTYLTQAALHNCMEPHGCTAAWEGDRLTIWDSTPSIFDVRDEVAARLGLPKHQVRVVKQFMGGGFGSKQIAWKHTAIAALLSKQSSRPVQLMLHREAENLASGNRNPTVQRVRLGAKRDGTFVFVEADLTLAVGAYMVGGEASDVAGTLPDAVPLPERQDPPAGRRHEHRAGRRVPRPGLRRRGVRARVGDGRAGAGARDGPARPATEELRRRGPAGRQAVQLARRAAPLHTRPSPRCLGGSYRA